MEGISRHKVSFERWKGNVVVFVASQVRSWKSVALESLIDLRQVEVGVCGLRDAAALSRSELELLSKGPRFVLNLNLSTRTLRTRLQSASSVC